MTDTTEEIVVDLNKNETEKEKETEKETPKETEKEVRSKAPQAQSAVPSKRIVDLTDNDKQIIINNAKNGIDNQFYDVKLFKNGNARICKKKKKTISNQAVLNNGERTISNKSNGETRSEQKIYMTDNQLMWEHLIELENKYNNLYRKHKKLKGRYNELYIEDDNTQTNEPINEQTNEPINETLSEFEPKAKQTSEQMIYQQQIKPLPMNWRTKLMQNRNFYVN